MDIVTRKILLVANTEPTWEDFEVIPDKDVTQGSIYNACVRFGSFHRNGTPFIGASILIPTMSGNVKFRLI